MLFWCRARLSAPFVDWRLIDTHTEVIGDEFLQVRRGTYVVLELRPILRASTVMYIQERVEGQGILAHGCVGVKPQWVVPDGAEETWQLVVGSMEDVGAAYDGVVAMVWDLCWEMSDDDEYLFDEDTNKRVLVYDVVILGSTWVFYGAEWNILYHHLSQWASTTHDNVWYDNV